MPTPTESRVLELLTAIDIPPDVLARQIEQLGTPGVTVLCDVALATYPGLRKKVRSNAVALLGWIQHPQAEEALIVAIGDSDPDLATRALRAAGRRQLATSIAPIAALLDRASTNPLVAAEAIKALAQINVVEAGGILSRYIAGDAKVPHRTSTVVERVLTRLARAPENGSV
jgi:HEAT repeat protein